MIAVDHEPSSSSAPVAGRGSSWRSWFDPGEPRLPRGPFTRWPRAADSVLAVVVFGASLVAVAVSALDDGEEVTFAAVGDRPVGALALLAVAAVALLWRRRQPVATTAFLLVVMIVWALAGYGDGQDLAVIVAVYSVGRHSADHRLGLITLAAVVAVSILGTVIDTHQPIDIIPAFLFTGLPWYLGRNIHNRRDYLTLLRERAERLEADQLTRARQAVADERSRIARELHDVVAHQVSMMTVQAGAAKTIARDDLDAAVDAMGDVERAGRQALGELRHLLGVLRPDTADTGDLGPQPGLANIATLVDQLSHTGADVTLAIGDLPAEVPASVDLSAYRIVQESFTNVIKHAGPKPTVDVNVRFDGHVLVIDITNTTNAQSPGLPASGYGIVGMRERAHLLGGTLTAAPQPPDHYRVQAHLPLELEPT